MDPYLEPGTPREETEMPADLRAALRESWPAVVFGVFTLLLLLIAVGWLLLSYL